MLSRSIHIPTAIHLNYYGVTFYCYPIIQLWPMGDPDVHLHLLPSHGSCWYCERGLYNEFLNSCPWRIWQLFAISQYMADSGSLFELIDTHCHMVDIRRDRQLCYQLLMKISCRSSWKKCRWTKLSVCLLLTLDHSGWTTLFRASFTHSSNDLFVISSANNYFYGCVLSIFFFSVTLCHTNMHNYMLQPVSLHHYVDSAYRRPVDEMTWDLLTMTWALLTYYVAFCSCILSVMLCHCLERKWSISVVLLL